MRSPVHLMASGSQNLLSVSPHWREPNHRRSKQVRVSWKLTHVLEFFSNISKLTPLSLKSVQRVIVRRRRLSSAPTLISLTSTPWWRRFLPVTKSTTHVTLDTLQELAAGVAGVKTENGLNWSWNVNVRTFQSASSQIFCVKAYHLFSITYGLCYQIFSNLFLQEKHQATGKGKKSFKIFFQLNLTANVWPKVPTFLPMIGKF